MNPTRYVMRASLAAAALAAGAALAQSPVLTDVSLAPPESRDSMGAVLLEEQMVLAQRKQFGQRTTPAEVQAIGREVIRKTIEEAQARGEDGPNTRALGGSPSREPAIEVVPGTRASKPPR